MRFLFLFFLFLASGAVPAVAAPCYGQTEAEAEALLRLHSKLMVVTVICHYGADGQELTPAYTAFTQKNLDSIRQAEATLKAFYKKNYGGDGLARLDRLRTLLGNEFGQEIAQVSAPAFCEANRGSVHQSLEETPDRITEEAQKLSASVAAYAPVCGSASRRL